MVVAFYLCAKKHKLKVDKIKLIELCGTSEAEFSSVSTTMKDLCHDVFGVAKEKKDPKEVKTNRGMFFPAFPALCADLLDVLPSKRKAEDGGYLSDDGAEGTLDCRI
ncbi:origin of replication complex subunit 6-like isoform X4 [Trifolium pratense]|nr:origin of replication complex subunit 6-like isoform X4 [Trifolium pratense]